MHAKKSQEEQKKALKGVGVEKWHDQFEFQQEIPVRKVFLPTNIAEASIIIPACAHVFDAGMVKRCFYDWMIRQESLVPVSIDQASATQRSGRTVQTCHGKAYRLYTKEHFDPTMYMTRPPPPDISQNYPTQMILKLTAIGVKSVLKFDFIQPQYHMAVLLGIGTLDSPGAFSSKGSPDLLSNLEKKG